MEGEEDYVSWGLWDDGSRGSSVEGGRDTSRKEAAMRNDRSGTTAGRVTKTREVMLGSM